MHATSAPPTIYRVRRGPAQAAACTYEAIAHCASAPAYPSTCLSVYIAAVYVYCLTDRVHFHGLTYPGVKLQLDLPLRVLQHRDPHRDQISLILYSYTMSALQTLPFLVQVDIVRHLPLADALAYSQTCVGAHDAVYYVFSHREQLDFSSVLDANDVIALDDHTVLKVLHAHVRATRITEFCLRAEFTLFDDLVNYFHTYWNVFTNVHGETVGHPSGHLYEVWLAQPRGIEFHAPLASKHRLLELWHSLDMYTEYISSVMHCRQITPPPPQYHNWSTVDLDTRFKPCPCCGFAIPSTDDCCQ